MNKIGEHVKLTVTPPERKPFPSQCDGCKAKIDDDNINWNDPRTPLCVFCAYPSRLVQPAAEPIRATVAIPDEQAIATDDRGIERVDAPCEHRRCPPGKCRAYTPETLAITDADMEKGRQLVAEGWRQTSHKHRAVIRWRVQPPTCAEIDALLRDRVGTPLIERGHLERLLEVWERGRLDFGSMSYARSPNASLVEHATLSPSLFKAFKKAGGRNA